MRIPLVLITLLMVALISLTEAWGNDRREHIMVSGGPALLAWEKLRFEADQHDKFYFNFVRPVAWARIPQLKKLYGKDASVTWLVYRPAYEKRQ